MKVIDPSECCTGQVIGLGAFNRFRIYFYLLQKPQILIGEKIIGRIAFKAMNSHDAMTHKDFLLKWATIKEMTHRSEGFFREGSSGSDKSICIFETEYDLDLFKTITEKYFHNIPGFVDIRWIEHGK